MELTPDQAAPVQRATDEHGATTVYRAAAEYMDGNTSLLTTLGLEPESLEMVQKIMTIAYNAIPDSDRPSG